MIDIQIIRDDPELVAKKSTEKGYKVDIKKLLEVDKVRRDLQTQVDGLRQKRNEISASMKGQKPSSEQVEAGKKVKLELVKLEAEFQTVDSDFWEKLRAVPNLTDDDVPVGGEEDSVEIKVFGDKPTGARDHLEFAVERDWLDFERGARVAGNKFYYLKGDLALLENAITQFALSFVLEKGFTFMTVPHMVNENILTGTGFMPRSSDQSDEYAIEGGDLSLIATAEIPLTGYHAGEIIDEKDLPLMYAGLSPCYRKEAGTYGKHTRGLFRVHQFNKLEMYAYCLPEDSRQMHEKLLSLEEELWQRLGIPYHVINIASGDLGAPAAKKYDIEYWSPVDGRYRELTSCSNCTDFQARNLNIRVRRSDGRVEVLHTLNGTAASLARSLVAILENYQTAEGKLRIPDVLIPFMQNRSEI